MISNLWNWVFGEAQKLRVVELNLLWFDVKTQLKWYGLFSSVNI